MLTWRLTCLSAWLWDACDGSSCCIAALCCALLGCSCRAASLDRATKASKSSSLELYAVPPSDLSMHKETVMQSAQMPSRRIPKCFGYENAISPKRLACQHKLRDCVE